MQNVMGKQVKDIVTGYEGIAVGVATHISGCDTIGIQRMTKDGKVETDWFDVVRVKVLGNGVSQHFATKAPVALVDGPQAKPKSPRPVPWE